MNVRNILVVVLSLAVSAPTAAVAECDHRYPARAFWHNGQGGVLVDVTKPPFSARGDGVHDDTAALSAAMRFVREHQQVACDEQGKVHCNVKRTTAWSVWLPNGTYRVTDTVCQGWPALAINVQLGWDHVRFIDVHSPAEERALGTAPGGRPFLHDDPTIGIIDTVNGEFFRGQYNNAVLYGESNESIRLEGESREGTIIRLDDGAKGFDTTTNKPVISFAMLLRGSNVNQGNFVENLTIDTGKGNSGASALLWSGSNYGGIRNVTLKSGDGNGAVGLDLTVNNACGYVRDLEIDGFRTGFVMAAGRESVLTMEDSSVRNCRLGFRLGGNDSGAGADLLALLDVDFENVAKKCEQRRASMLHEETGVAKPPRMKTAGAVAVVEDFGAAGDGVTDDTDAIRCAFASGCATVLFTRPIYRVDGEVVVSAGVVSVDGLHANLVRTRASDRAVFRCEGNAAAPVTFRRFFVAGGVLVDHVSDRVVVIEDAYAEFHHGRETFFSDGKRVPKGCDPASGLWYVYRNATPERRKRVYLSNCIQPFPGGAATGADALVNVDLSARLLNAEHFPGPNFSFRNCTARIWGLKSEDAPVLFSLKGSDVKVVCGTFLMFQSLAGPVVETENSSFDFNLYFWHWQFVPRVMVREIGGEGPRDLLSSAFAAERLRAEEICHENACTVRLTSP